MTTTFTQRVSQKAQKAISTGQNTGQQIMQVAEIIRPILLEKLRGAIDEHGMPVQPARIRGMSLVLAQSMVQPK